MHDMGGKVSSNKIIILILQTNITIFFLRRDIISLYGVYREHVHSTVQSLQCSLHRAHIGVEQKQGEHICPLRWSAHHNFVRDCRYSERGWAPPSSLGRIFLHDGMYVRKWPLRVQCTCIPCLQFLYVTHQPIQCHCHRVHRVATAAFWRAFSDEGKIGPGW